MSGPGPADPWSPEGGIDRRRALGLLGGASAAGLLAACSPGTTPPAPTTAAGAPSTSAAATAAATAGASASPSASADAAASWGGSFAPAPGLEPVLRAGDRVLFIGDSITDGGRNRAVPSSLGSGYPALVASFAQVRRAELGLTFLNRGVASDTTADVRARWSKDALALEPQVISLLIGINDATVRTSARSSSALAQYEDLIDEMLGAARAQLDARFVLVEPFVLPVSAEQRGWRDDIAARIDAVRRLATTYDAALVPADALLWAAAVRTRATQWCGDGVHPTPQGHDLLARAWVSAVGL